MYNLENYPQTYKLKKFMGPLMENRNYFEKQSLLSAASNFLFDVGYEYEIGLYEMANTRAVKHIRANYFDFNDKDNIRNTAINLLEEYESEKMFKAEVPFCISTDGEEYQEIAVDDVIRERNENVRDRYCADISSAQAKHIKAMTAEIAGKIFSKRKKDQKTVLRFLRLIRCGTHFETNEGVADVYVCKSKGCKSSACISERRQHKKKKIKKDTNAMYKEANKEGYFPVFVTLTTPWALPENETRALLNKNNGKNKNTLSPQQASISFGGENLTVQRYLEHKKAKKKFFTNKNVRKILKGCINTTLEIAYLEPGVRGNRYLPNPHTHALSCLANEDFEEAAQELTKIWAKISKHANAEVLAVQAYEDTKHIQRYLAKEDVITSMTGNEDMSPINSLDPVSVQEMVALENIRGYDNVNYSITRNKSKETHMEEARETVKDALDKFEQRNKPIAIDTEPDEEEKELDRILAADPLYNDLDEDDDYYDDDDLGHYVRVPLEELTETQLYLLKQKNPNLKMPPTNKQIKNKKKRERKQKKKGLRKYSSNL